METAAAITAPNGTRRHWMIGRRHSPETRKKMSESRKAVVAKKKAEKEARQAEISRKRSAAAKARWGKADTVADAVAKAIETPEARVSLPLTFVLACISTADLIEELGRRANP